MLARSSDIRVPPSAERTVLEKARGRCPAGRWQSCPQVWPRAYCALAGIYGRSEIAIRRAQQGAHTQQPSTEKRPRFGYVRYVS
jgi:hypothetical protein